MPINNIVFPYYHGNIKNSLVAGHVHINQFFRAIRSPKPHILSTLDQIKIASEQKNESLRAKLKTQLYSFTPAVYIPLNTRRKYSEIQSFTGIAVLDFDKIDNAIEFKQYLFHNYDYIYATWLSASKRGVRALIKIPIVESTDQYKLHFNALVLKFGIYNGFDKAPQNCVLPLFQSFDPEILVNENSRIFTDKYKPTPPSIPEIYKTSESNDNLEGKIKHLFSKIHDNGHPQLRKIAYLAGGWVGAGNMNYHDALNLILSEIDKNPYLQQKAETYKKTAKTMILAGIEEPCDPKAYAK